MMIAINPEYQLTLRKIGRQKTPVLILDRVLQDIAPLREHACQQVFDAPSDVIYPGVRAYTSEQYSREILRVLNWLIKTHYALPVGLRMQPRLGEYSLLTTPEADLQPLQCLPHIDYAGAYHFAVLHYVNDGDFDGTGFYRHRPTGLECVTEAEAERYFGHVRRHVEDEQVVTDRYFTDSTAEYDLLDTVDYRADRLLVYPTTLLHSGYIKTVDKNLSDDPATGRLTTNFFLRFA